MKRKYSIIALAIGCLLSAFSCSQTKKTTSSDIAFDDNYDNSEYVLQTKSLKVEGIEMSHDCHTAKVKSLTNARKEVLDTLSTLVNNIAVRRGFDTSMPREFYLSALRRTNYYEDQTHNDEGELLYRCTCEAEVMLLPMLESIFKEKHFPANYGYYQFLRDVDILLISNKK